MPSSKNETSAKTARVTRPRKQSSAERKVLASVAAASQSQRPRQNDRSSQVEQEIFRATERLLDKHNARDVSVALILEESGISRATFYHYFSSKWEVVNFMAGSVMAEIYERIQQFVGGDDLPREEALRRSIVEGCEVWAAHQAVLRAIVDHWREVPELRALMASVLAPFREALVKELERERAAGIAPPGPPAEQLIAALLWSSLSCLHVAGLPDVDDIHDEASVASVLIHIWMSALYGHA